MTVTILRESTAPARLTTAALDGRTVAVLGYGNQGRAHALNLRESAVSVVVGNRPDTPNAARARSEGFEVLGIPEAASRGDLVILALPDEAQPHVYEKLIRPRLRPGATLGFLHGFAVRFGEIETDEGVGVVLVAPKGPGTTLRQLYTQGRGLPALVAVEQENAAGDAESIALAWATGIGAGRSGVILTTFADETETDLFGEQAVLCGGMTGLLLAAFETLVDAGYPPELAYLECCHEVKQVADLLYARGPAGMNRAISNTAEFGAFAAAPRIVDDHVRDAIAALLTDIRSGAFAQRLRADYERGGDWLAAQRARLESHPIEQAGEAVRGLMPWLDSAADESESA